MENIDALPFAWDAPAFGQIARDAAVYGKDAWYPAEVAVLSEPAIFRDLRVVQLDALPGAGQSGDASGADLPHAGG